jgi:hypothetical protein
VAPVQCAPIPCDPGPGPALAPTGMKDGNSAFPDEN